MFVYGLSSTFVGFVAAEIMGGVGLTFRSGAFKAWLVDSLKHHGYEGEYGPIFGRQTLYDQIGGGIGAVVGSYLSAFHPSLPWFFGGIVLCTTAVVAGVVMKEDYFKPAVFSWKLGLASMKDIAMKSVRYGMNHKAVRFVLMATGLQIFAVQALNMYWQPFFKSHGVGDRQMGFIYIGIMAMAAIGAYLVSKFSCYGKEKRAIVVMVMLSGVLALITPLVPGLPLMLAFYLLHELPRGAWFPLMDAYLQKRIPSAERATISSFCAVAPHIGGAVGLVVSGVIAQKFGIMITWVISGLFLVIGGLAIARNGNGDSDGDGAG